MVIMKKNPQNILDYAEIINEPVFVIRAQDILSVPILDQYIHKYEKAGKIDPLFHRDLVKIKESFIRWQAENRTRLKLPD